MKKIYILLFTLLLLNFTKAQWIAQTSGTTNVLNSVYFINSDTGYAVGGNGTILKTSNGGIAWKMLSSGGTFNSVYFPDANTGYAVGKGGYGGLIFKTINGGSTWTSLYYGSQSLQSLNSVYFINSDTGYAVGYPGFIIKTTNGGRNWIYLINEGGYFYSVYFTDANTGYVAGGSLEPFIFRTANGFNTWISSNCVKHLRTWAFNSVYFPDANTGYAVGGKGTIIKTSDGGNSWDSLLSGTKYNLNSVYFINSDTGYAVGDNGTILKTSNGGTIWIVSSSGTTNVLNSVYFINSDIGYAVGDGGTILKTNNGGGTSIEENELTKTIFNIYPNPANNKITINNKDNLFKESQISILNMAGQQVISEQFNSQNKIEMNVSSLVKGIYFVRIQTNSGIESKKLVIQ